MIELNVGMGTGGVSCIAGLGLLIGTFWTLFLRQWVIQIDRRGFATLEYDSATLNLTKIRPKSIERDL